jgi:integrase
MQRGSLSIVIRKEGPAVWQFRWSEKALDGARVQRKRVIGTVERYPNEAAARSAVTVLLAEVNSEKTRIRTRSVTVAQLCDHFEQRELAKDNTWRSHATKKTYQAYLNRWVRPHWRHFELAEVRTIQVECWLRRLPLAKSSCAKIRNLMSVLFNHACRYELFDRNPIHLVRQSAKRRRTPTFLMPAEIKALVDNLSIRERTLVLLAVSTGLRQSELFGLKWGDIDFCQGTECNAIHRLRRRWSVQDRIIAEAGTHPSTRCRCAFGVAKTINVHKARRLGFCKQTAPRTVSILGTSDFKKICSTNCGEGRNPEMYWLAHVS